MGKKFGDVEIAHRMRVAIVDIVHKEIERLRPEARIAEVLDFSPETLIASVRFAGDKGSLNARFGPSSMPRAAGNVVRVAGSPGNYYITEILNDTAVHQTYEPVAADVIILGEQVQGKISHAIADDEPVGTTYGDLWSQPQPDGGFKRYYWNDILLPPAWVPVPVATEDLIDNAVTGPKLLVGAVDGQVITGAVFQTSTAADKGIHLDLNGLRAYDNVGGSAPFMNVDPTAGLVIVAGQGTFKTLTVDGPGAGSQLGGTTVFPPGAHVTLTGGANPPTSAPVAEASFLSLQYGVPSGAWTDRAGWSPLLSSDTSDYVTFNKATNRVEKWGNVENGSGTVDATSAAFTGSDGSAISGVAVDDTGDNIWVLYKATTGLWTLRQYRASDMVWLAVANLNYPAVIDTAAGAKTPVIGFDPTVGEANPILIGQARANGKIRISRLSVNGVPGPFVDTNYTLAQNLLAVGFDEGDGASTPFDFSPGDGDMYYFIGTDNQVRFYQVPLGVVNATLGFDSGALGGADSVVGFYWGGSKFVSMSGTGLNRIYSAMALGDNPTSTNLRKWITQTKSRTANGYETPQSPAVMVQLKKRQQIALTGDALLTSPGVNDPTGVKFYIGQGATDPSADPSQMSAFTTQPVGTNKRTYTTLPAIPGTVHPPSGNNFPNSSPSILDTQLGGWSVNNLGDGDPGSGSFGQYTRNYPGMMSPFAGATPPPGWVMCDGTLTPLNTIIHAALFAVIGYTFGGSGTTFYPPDMRGRFALGAGTTQTSGTSRARGSTGGSDKITTTEMPSHWHNATTPDGNLDTNTTGSSHTHGIQRGDAVGSAGQRQARGNSPGAPPADSDTTTAGSTHTHGVVGHTASTGSDGPYMPPYLGLNFIIKL